MSGLPSELTVVLRTHHYRADLSHLTLVMFIAVNYTLVEFYYIFTSPESTVRCSESNGVLCSSNSIKMAETNLNHL